MWVPPFAAPAGQPAGATGREALYCTHARPAAAPRRGGPGAGTGRSRPRTPRNRTCTAARPVTAYNQPPGVKLAFTMADPLAPQGGYLRAL
jgi:hypothetical protein